MLIELPDAPKLVVCWICTGIPGIFHDGCTEIIRFSAFRYE